eukprot:CAMPEP_0183334356 /NCGR_PEP_ID=MMETSP0164_2-20130417/2986_1 /TAXON_ID=221442 /ORGANISM="Coccolithus pelagicus ssp braarudi, Strain PLY182g" /LENGTH=208 /DNA_ID=CAMNT_0025503475 /DNA_START=349 /DNA_END=973 /DNA_ORIENTATION=+
MNDDSLSIGGLAQHSSLRSLRASIGRVVLQRPDLDPTWTRPPDPDPTRTLTLTLTLTLTRTRASEVESAAVSLPVAEAGRLSACGPALLAASRGPVGSLLAVGVAQLRECLHRVGLRRGEVRDAGGPHGGGAPRRLLDRLLGQQLAHRILTAPKLLLARQLWSYCRVLPAACVHLPCHAHRSCRAAACHTQQRAWQLVDILGHWILTP